MDMNDTTYQTDSEKGQSDRITSSTATVHPRELLPTHNPSSSMLRIPGAYN
jgi:hypothetical protein